MSPSLEKFRPKCSAKLLRGTDSTRGTQVTRSPRRFQHCFRGSPCHGEEIHQISSCRNSIDVPRRETEQLQQVAGVPSLPTPESRLDSVLQCQKRTATKDYQFQGRGQSRGLIITSTFPLRFARSRYIDRTISRDLSAGSVSYTAPNLKSNSALFPVESMHYGRQQSVILGIDRTIRISLSRRHQLTSDSYEYYYRTDYRTIVP